MRSRAASLNEKLANRSLALKSIHPDPRPACMAFEGKRRGRGGKGANVLDAFAQRGGEPVRSPGSTPPGIFRVASRA